MDESPENIPAGITPAAVSPQSTFILIQIRAGVFFSEVFIAREPFCRIFIKLSSVGTSGYCNQVPFVFNVVDKSSLFLMIPIPRSRSVGFGQRDDMINIQLSGIGENPSGIRIKPFS